MLHMKHVHFNTLPAYEKDSYLTVLKYTNAEWSCQNPLVERCVLETSCLRLSHLYSGNTVISVICGAAPKRSGIPSPTPRVM